MNLNSNPSPLWGTPFGKGSNLMDKKQKNVIIEILKIYSKTMTKFYNSKFYTKPIQVENID